MAAAVIPDYPNRDLFVRMAGEIDVSTFNGVAGEQWLFLASVGKRSATYLLERAADILENIHAGNLGPAEQHVASRLIRGFTTEDYANIENQVEIGLAAGGSIFIEGPAFWNLLMIDEAQAVSAVDVLALHLVLLVVIVVRTPAGSRAAFLFWRLHCA